MDIKDWQMLKTLHAEKSITKTAIKLYLSQPALTYRLDQLEKEMGVKLFIRSTKGIRFTSAGERLFSYADKMIRKYSDIKNHVTMYDGIVSGTLRLGCSSVVAHNKLPELLKEFHKRYPSVEISLHTGLSDELLKKLYSEEITTAIIRGNHIWKEGDILLQDESFCIISAQPINLRDLPNIPGIRYHTDTTLQYTIDRWWQGNFSVPPKILMNTDNISTCLKLVIAGLGWAIVPAMRVHESAGKLFAKEIKSKKNKPYTRATRLIYRNTAREVDAEIAFIKFICEKFSIPTLADGKSAVSVGLKDVPGYSREIK